VFGGLKPMSVRFIEAVFEKKGFKNMGSKRKFLPYFLLALLIVNMFDL
jgi:hypothetical protein